jgi:hypothetical protein
MDGIVVPETKVIPGRFLAENLSRNFTLAHSESLRRRDVFCRPTQENNDIYYKGVIAHALCFIFSNNKKRVARSSLAGGSEWKLVLDHDLPTDSAYREEDVCASPPLKPPPPRRR